MYYAKFFFNSKTLSIKLTSISTRLPILGGAILWMGFHAWVLQDVFSFDWSVAVWDSFLFNVFIFNGALLLGVLLNYLPKAGLFQITIGLALILAFTVQWISQELLVMLIEGNALYLDFLLKSKEVRWAIGFVIIVSAGVVNIFYIRWKELRDGHNQEATTHLMVKEAELQKLQLQLQPHFLFNSLNSINALIITQPDKAGKMVQQLSDFLRATLRRADEQWITLAKEIEYLQLYLSIEKVRFGHRLNVQMNLDEQIELWLIPPLLLQPLVENAIKFGLYGTTGQVVIHLSTKREGDILLIEISNPFDHDMQPAEGSGFGLNGLRRRLYLLYARNDLLTTRIEENKFIVRLMLPEKYD